MRPSVPTKIRTLIERFVVFGALIGMVFVFEVPLAKVSAITQPAPMYYLALGDSLAAGLSAVPGHGYVDNVYQKLNQRLPQLQLVNFGCSGETIESFIKGSLCPSPTQSQLQSALDFIRQHQGQVAAITLDIGANDVDECLSDANPMACVQRGTATVKNGLPQILAPLRQATGPSVPLAVMTYYDPFLALAFQNPSLAAVASWTEDRATEFNQAIRAAAAPYGAEIADAEAAFHTHDHTPVPPPYGTANIAYVCHWTFMGCGSYDAGSSDFHANTAGHLVLAEVMLAAIDLSVFRPANKPPATASPTLPPAVPTPPPANRADPTFPRDTSDHNPLSDVWQRILVIGAFVILIVVIVEVISRRRRRID